MKTTKPANLNVVHYNGLQLAKKKLFIIAEPCRDGRKGAIIWFTALPN